MPSNRSKYTIAKLIGGYAFSLSFFAGITPLIHLRCGKCNHYFSRRFSVSECAGRNPLTVCPKCGEVNKVPVKYG